MTREEVALMIEEIGLPCAYYQFPEDTGQAPPYVVFFYSNTDDLYADNENYTRIEVLNIEFYSDVRDFETEARIEQILKNHGFSFYVESSYIDSEKMQQTAYEMEVLINGEE